VAKKTKRLPPAQHEMIVAWVLGGADAVGWHSTQTFYALVKAGYLDQGSPTQRARDYVDQWALGGTREELEAAAERELFGKGATMNVSYEHIGPLIEAWAIVSDAYFDMAQGLYWFAADNHGGMSDPLYGILSTLGYGPAPSERGPNTEVSVATYEFLASLQGVEQLEAALELQDYIGRRSAGENPRLTRKTRFAGERRPAGVYVIVDWIRSGDRLQSEWYIVEYPKAGKVAKETFMVGPWKYSSDIPETLLESVARRR